MLRWALTLCCCLLTACAMPVLRPPDADALLRDEAFRPPSVRPDVDAIFRLSPAMQSLVERELAPSHRGDPRRALVDRLYRRQGLALEYETTHTRTAAEAFEARAGNCLSLVIMTAAFAKALQMPVRFQRVDLPENWTRASGLQFASGHVNIALDLPLARAQVMRELDPALVVDFVPAGDLRTRRMQGLAERTVIAMYLNNRAAETLAEGDTDGAYWWSREAVRQDPLYVAGWNTLGVVYLQHGLVEASGHLFATLLQREPDNPKLLANLALVLERQGRDDAARQLRERLAQLEPVAPFQHYDAGRQAMADGDFARARELFALELRRDAWWHELHLWMARAELALGHTGEGRRHLELAREASTTTRERALYAAKLERLRSLH